MLPAEAINAAEQSSEKPRYTNEPKLFEALVICGIFF
jgi:hypothetical protein